jgi:hypothetical protein
MIALYQREIFDQGDVGAEVQSLRREPPVLKPAHQTDAPDVITVPRLDTEAALRR